MALIYILAILSYSIALRLLLNFFTPGLHSIPGPFWAKFSNLWRLVSTARGHHEITLQRLHRLHGNVVRVGPNALSIADPEAIKSIYGFKTDFVKSDFTKVMQTIKDGRVLPVPGTVIDRKEHARRRKPFVAAFSVASPTKYEPFVDVAICQMIERLDQEFISSPYGKRVCEADKWLQYFAFDCVGQMCFGRSFGFMEQGKDVEGLIASVVSTFDYFAVVGQMPWLDLWLRKNPVASYIFNATNPFAVRAREMLQERLTELKSSKDCAQGDITSGILEIRENEHENVSGVSMVSLIINTLLVGSDSTSVALRPIIYYLSKHRQVQARLQSELDQATLKYPVSWDACQSLKYLDAVIREACRFHPAGSILLERVVPQSGLVLRDGIRVPAGTVVGMFGWTVHRDQNIYGEDANTFNPDRWLRGAESEESFRHRTQKMKQAELGFGHGTRSCVGRHIALLEMYKLVATLFGLFDIEPVDPKKDWKVRSAFFARPSEMNVLLKWRGNSGLSTLRSRS